MTEVFSCGAAMAPRYELFQATTAATTNELARMMPMPAGRWRETVPVKISAAREMSNEMMRVPETTPAKRFGRSRKARSYFSALGRSGGAMESGLGAGEGSGIGVGGEATCEASIPSMRAGAPAAGREEGRHDRGARSEDGGRDDIGEGSSSANGRARRKIPAGSGEAQASDDRAAPRGDMASS